MVLIGIAEYRDFAPFVANVTDGLGALSLLGTMWAYVLPALFIFGGAMLMVGRYPHVTAWIGGMAFASIPAGMLFKTLMTGIPLPDMLAAAFPSLVWMLAFTFAICAQPENTQSQEQES